ncbi:MAG TPA: ankyrin repeat domain-containing protein [Candidatus Rifleibacterium sp.]|nr:ankyrin repeat domain-containing protein [Candidatus Rifleibacterium sp.]HPT47255.1 ankyrin repeat domain-containing protein [Candidatus Rifleibacterium sp.]
MKRLFFVIVLLILPFAFVLADEDKETEDFNLGIFVETSTDEEVKAFVLESPERINKGYGPSNNTILHAAVLEGRYDLIKFLLDSGADPNLVDAANASPLASAAEECNFEIVKLLLAYKANPNIRCNSDMSPAIGVIFSLHSSNRNDHFENAKKVVELLAPQTEFENDDDITLAESSINDERDSIVKAKKIELLNIFKAKAIKH